MISLISIENKIDKFHLVNLATTARIHKTRNFLSPPDLDGQVCETGGNTDGAIFATIGPVA